MTAKRVFAIIALCLMTVALLTACGDKKVITPEDFSQKATADDMQIGDATEQYAQYDHIVNVTVAKHSDGWQVELLTSKDAETAIGMYESNKEDFENTGSSATEDQTGSAYSQISVGNSNVYSAERGGKFQYLCRVDNTLLYANIDMQYKDAAQDFIKKIGY